MAIKRKNVILLHLESVSRSTLWQYRCELGTVWRLMSSSRQFNRFFTSSTSTEMSIADLMYGDAGIKDANPVFRLARRGFTLADVGGHLNELVRDNGYRYLHLGSSPYSPRLNSVNDTMVAINEPNVPTLCEKALAHFVESKNRGVPFFAYFWDDSSHLAYVSPFKEKAPGVPERLRTAYALIDASLNRLLSGLSQAGLWDDTIIVGFGDHGDEAWTHDLNRGYCHSIVPYSSITWTPMFIYDPERWSGGIDSRLVSMVDLKQTVLSMLCPDVPPLPRRPYGGIDIFKEKRDFAFSQNMFALQREYSDPEQGMVKGYAVTDGDYRLLVSSGGCNPEAAGGMALYCDQVDPSNSLNLLKFFRLDREGGIRRFVPPPDATAKHFSYTFSPPRVESLIAAYNRLRPRLQAFIKEKEAAALDEYEKIQTLSVDELLDCWREKVMALSGKEIDNSREYRQRLKAALHIELTKQEFMQQKEYQLFPQKMFTQVRQDRIL